MISESTKPDFDRDGFVVVSQFLTGDELAELHNRQIPPRMLDGVSRRQLSPRRIGLRA